MAENPAAKKRLSNYTLLVIGALSLLASLWVSKHFIVETLVAGFLVVLFKPLQDRLERGKLGKHRHLLASLLTTGVVILILMPIALLVVLLVDQVIHAVDFVREQIGNGGLAQIFTDGSPVARLWEKVQHVLPISTDQLKEQAMGATKLIAPTLGGILALSGETFLGALVLIFATFYFFVDGEALGQWMLETLPLNPRYSRELFTEFRSVSYAMVVGSTLTALATGVIASLGYWMLGVPSPLVWGTLTGLCQVAPAVGNMLIWVPVVVLLALTGHVVHACSWAWWSTTCCGRSLSAAACRSIRSSFFLASLVV